MAQHLRSRWMRLALAEAVVIAVGAVALLALLLALDPRTLELMSFVPH